MAVTRTFTIEDITPQELAEVFMGWYAEEQADFFSSVWTIGRTWPGAGWCQQSCAIVEKLTVGGRDAIKTIAAHLEEQAA